MRQTYNKTRQAFLFGMKYVQSPGRQVDWGSVPERYRHGTVTVTLTAAAAANATTITAKLPTGAKVAKGQLIDFGGTKMARVAANVTGTGAAQAITVDALPTALLATDAGAIYGTGPKFVPAGTTMTKSGTQMVPYAAVPGATDVLGLILTDATQPSGTDAVTGYGLVISGVVFENLLPDAVGGTLPNDIKTKLANVYGGAWQYETYYDGRGA